MEIEQKLVKSVVKMGNSACVLLPKSWIHGRAKIELIENPIDIKNDIFDILNDYLEDVLGIYLVGSYARGEQTPNSDIDVLVITSKTNKRIEKDKYEIILISQHDLEKQLEKNIFPLLPMIKEAKPLINSILIKEYKNNKLNKNNLKFFLDTTKSAMNVIRESIKLSKEMNIDEGDASAYSLILRLRGIYIIDCFKKNKIWSNSEFLKLIKTIAGSLRAYDGYLRVKSDKKMQHSLPVEEAEKLYTYILTRLKKQREF